MKDKLRIEMSELRRGYDEVALRPMNDRIKVNLFSMPEFMDSRTVMFYASKENEVDTHAMIMDAINIGKRVVVPYVLKEGKEIIPLEIKSYEDLRPGSFGVMEPRREYCREVSPEEIDVVIVPGIAFDKKGDRLGYGMGFYDRFLSKAAKAQHIGLAYEFQILDHMDSEGHDVRVGSIVTEKRVLKT